MTRSLLLIASLLLCSVSPAEATPDTVSFGRFGQITVYRGDGEARNVVLFLSGDGGWNPGVISMAEHLTAKGGAAPAERATPLAHLPLIIVPAAAGTSSPWFGIFLSGDGGWVGLDRGVSKELAKHGIPIVGWDSLKYFWSPRTPEGTAGDLDRVIEHYASTWGKTHVLLVGYSQGADTLPFMVNRLPPAERDRVGLTALVALSDNALFEFHLATWLGSAERGVPTGPELERWSGSPYVCIYGVDDHDAACDKLAGPHGSVVKMSGGHHFGGRYADIAKEIFSRLPTL